MFYQAKENKLKLKDFDLDYITFGKGDKPLVMIQGLNTRNIKGAAMGLAYMYRGFAKDYKVYLFDRRPNVHHGITVRDMAEDVAMAMDALNITNADVFGVSQGGMIAQYLAIDRPDLVKKMVLSVTLSRNNPTLEKVIRSWMEMTRRGDMKALVRDMAEKMYSQEYLKRYRIMLPILTIWQKPRDVERFLILSEACLTCKTYDMLEKITCPVLVLGGAKDQVLTGEASLEMAEKAGWPVYLYENLGHATYEEAKDFNQRVLDFFREE